MKVILTGNTGLIGKEVLSQCITNPAITSIVALSRRDLSVESPKLTQIKHEDFTNYPSSLLEELKGADACIWSLGIAIPKTAEDGKRINLDFPLAAAKAFDANRDGKPFRFVYVSGYLTEKDQNKNLWFMGEGRKMRGRTELELLKFNKDGNEIHIPRPGFVGAKDGSFKDLAIGLFTNVIKVDQLAAAMVQIATSGGDQPFHEMDELMKSGKALTS